jgi:multidrug efflux pump subunit AcrA (membrane-fusion protein)
MKKPKKRQIYIVLGILILVGAILLTSQFFKMEGRKDAQRSLKANPVVSVFTAKPDIIDSYITFTGRVRPVESISLFAEVGGVLQSSNKPFETGVDFQKGELLVKIEEKEARQNLIAQKNSFLSTLSRIIPNLSIDYPDQYEKWNKYLAEFNVHEPLPKLPEVNDEQFRLYLAGNNVYTQYYSISQLETRFNKYNIYAPFNGTLTEARIEEGTLVRVGQNLGEFMNLEDFEIEAAVASEEIKYLHHGKMVMLSSNNDTFTYKGRIVRMNDKVDPQTQTINFFIQMPDNAQLKPGSYVTGRAKADSYEDAVKVNNDLLVQNNHLFVVSDSTASLHQIEIQHMSKDSAIVKGLREGILVVNEVKLPAFEGAKVNIEK